MEEDKKILEELTGAKIKFILAPEDRGFIAIENLIKRYRELEEENKAIRIERNTVVTEYRKFKRIADNSIPKSKIKEKIEELKKEYEIALEENSIKAFILKCQIDILEKLMEEK